jgi:hypothetical protein
MKIRVKPETYEAIQFNGDNYAEIVDFIPDSLKSKTKIFHMSAPDGRDYLKIDSLYDEFILYIGEYIIKNDRNNLMKQTADEIKTFYDVIEE